MKELPFDPYDFFGYLATGLLVLYGLQYVVGVPEIAGKELKSFDIVVVTLAAYVTGQLAATPAKAVLEDILARRVLKPPSVNLMREPTKGLRQFLFPGYTQPLSETARKKILARVAAEGVVATEGEDLFAHIRFKDYIRADAPLMARLSTFLNKYGFSRNLSFTALTVGIGVLAVQPFDLHSDLTRYALLVAFAGLCLLYRYLKFYRQYSYELFNAYAGRT